MKGRSGNKKDGDKAKKPHHLTFSRGIPQLGLKIHFIFCPWDDEELDRLLKKLKISKYGYSPSDYKTLQGYNHQESNISSSVVWMPEIPCKNSDVGILSHEICHAICHFFRYFGHTDSEELFCSLQGWLLEESLNEIDKYRK